MSADEHGQRQSLIKINAGNEKETLTRTCQIVKLGLPEVQASGSLRGYSFFFLESLRVTSISRRLSKLETVRVDEVISSCSAWIS
jgi:hypothetical protein